MFEFSDLSWPSIWHFYTNTAQWRLNVSLLIQVINLAYLTLISLCLACVSLNKPDSTGKRFHNRLSQRNLRTGLILLFYVHNSLYLLYHKVFKTALEKPSKFIKYKYFVKLLFPKSYPKFLTFSKIRTGQFVFSFSVLSALSCQVRPSTLMLIHVLHWSKET